MLVRVDADRVAALLGFGGASVTARRPVWSLAGASSQRVVALPVVRYRRFWACSRHEPNVMFGGLQLSTAYCSSCRAREVGRWA